MRTQVKKVTSTSFNSKSIYFPNLNGLRFVAAFMVIVHHIEQIKHLFKIDSVWLYPPIYNAGSLGVVLFFVLSGFLITNLLLSEKETYNTISIKKFYTRRMLRIWPLYFFIIFLALFVLPYLSFFKMGGYNSIQLHNHFLQKIFLYVFLLPNLALCLFGDSFAAHTWSIGVEEQFYIIWPIALKLIKNKFLFILSVILFYLMTKYTLHKFILNAVILSFCDVTKIDCMSIGGLFAIIVKNNSQIFLSIKKIIFSKYIQYPVFAITAFFISQGYTFGFFQFEVYSVLFGIIICNLALNQNRIVNLEFRWLNYLGKISYGLYMYQPFVILFVINLLNRYGAMNNILIYLLSIGLTIIIASLSYHYFERPFISMKVRFSALISGDNTKSAIT